MAQPGQLYVTMEPQPGLPSQQFHEWYNNEHGPTRLSIPEIFANGLRYQATDGQKPTFLAAYDVTDMSHLETETYLKLRANRSPREAQTIGQVDVVRYFWDLVSTDLSPLFLPIERLTNDEAEGISLAAVHFTLSEDSASAGQKFEEWYKNEYSPAMSKAGGWLRSRLYKTSRLEGGKGPASFLALVDFAKGTSLNTEQVLPPSSAQSLSTIAQIKSQRTYSLFYVFGAGSRDLQHLSQLDRAQSTFTSADSRTRTTNDPEPVIESTVTTPDGLVIPYRLEGNTDPKAPVIAFCNSLLTSLKMWDPFVAILKSKRPQYQLLRYDTRGRHAIPLPPTPATLDMVSADLAFLMTSLRIDKLDTLIGVSMGGATTLRFALDYPDRLDRYVACDFNAASSAANTEAWKGRIAMAETARIEESGKTGIEHLAAQTVERWFHPTTMTQKRDTVVPWMTDMVAANHIEGFRYGCQALWDYDMKSEIKRCKVPGLMVVGEGDGKGALVKAMDSFRGQIGPKEEGVELAIVPEAGHLPMCESPEGFWTAVEKFL
ncbi:Alpha/Beta hydrolase protein [Microdochium bolleyi]|uniref:Alpha/Beta hydrolase protein n=1 Tax=Microdochium bolleyi TaxID=196109 RepID=A0A136JGT0_9PEZI|nr:Alpha/Beta hydrolase protein [Microdochium bolleyi]